ENEVWRRYISGGADRIKRSAGLLVEVQIRVAYLADLFFRRSSRSISHRIHADENVGTRLILLLKPGLKRNARNCFGGKNALCRLLPNAIPDEHCRMVTQLVQGIYIFRRG